jgi:hypothetical protein
MSKNSTATQTTAYAYIPQQLLGGIKRESQIIIKITPLEETEIKKSTTQCHTKLSRCSHDRKTRVKQVQKLRRTKTATTGQA